MNNEKAFTLIELMIAIMIFGVISVTIGASFVSGTRVKQLNEDVTEIQQNIRVSMQIMSHELRLAGYEIAPKWDIMSTSTTNQIIGSNSSITFYYVTNDSTIDTDGDGSADAGTTVGVTYSLDTNSNLVRTSSTVTYNTATKSFSPVNTPVDKIIASNIDALYFKYLIGNGVSAGTWSDTPTAQSAPSVANPTITRAVEICLVARGNKVNQKAGAKEIQYTEPINDDVVFTKPADDRFRRRLVSTVVNLRNMK